MTRTESNSAKEKILERNRKASSPSMAQHLPASLLASEHQREVHFVWFFLSLMPSVAECLPRRLLDGSPPLSKSPSVVAVLFFAGISLMAARAAALHNLGSAIQLVSLVSSLHLSLFHACLASGRGGNESKCSGGGDLHRSQ